MDGSEWMIMGVLIFTAGLILGGLLGSGALFGISLMINEAKKMGKVEAREEASAP